MREKFVSLMSDRVSARVDSTSEPTLNARSFVEAAISKAAAFEVVAEEDVARFIDILQQLGPEFPEGLPWASEILNDDTLDAAFRIDAIEERAMAQTEDTL